MIFDLIINNGLYFDGTGARGLKRNIGIVDGHIAAVSAWPLIEDDCPRVIDASGKWVMPGFLETHSHYDAEIIAAPALKESVRHGITTVAIGSCSLSAVVSEPDDCSDLFTRVEAVPRSAVLPLLQKTKTWHTPREYRSYYEQHPLGPNVCSFIGHSDLRVAVMGLDRATRHIAPTKAEMRKMEAMLEDALDAGLLGLSVMTTKLDKIDGDRAWSRPLPSTFARWSEFSRLFAILRRRNGILQGAPDAVTKINVVAFLWHAAGWFRNKLRTTLLTALDLKSQPYLHLMTRFSGWFARHVLRANFRWQFLPSPMQIFCDGLDFTNFEEFTAGEILRDTKDIEQQYELIKDPAYRARFKKDLKAVLTLGLWHRDFSDAYVADCPDTALLGRNFAEIGRAQGKDPVDAFFDLCLIHRDKLRWGTVIGNQRPHIVHKLLRSPGVQIGFADSGAHIRTLAFYNFSLRVLKYVRNAELAGQPFMEMGQAVRRVTGELGDWFGLDAGYIRAGDRADVVIVNPDGLTGELDEVHEAGMENLELVRLVNRNDAAVEATIISGRIAYERGPGFAEDLGKQRGYGRFLSAKNLLPRRQPISIVHLPAATAVT
ncbi:MAG: N-acyl-D-amino-acid deacylase family protein [Stenotrophobium sp.]